MKIQHHAMLSTNNYKNISFKKGLTSKAINEVRNMNCIEHNNLVETLNVYFGINIENSVPNTVLKCVYWTSQIMLKAGFQLPKNFLFKPISEGVLGSYNPFLDTVKINSDYKEFYDIETQNKLEESQGNFHPDSKHFLATYLHEFSHAAHYKNLCKKLGINEAYRAFMGYLSQYSPRDIIVAPMNKMIKANFSIFPDSIIDKLFPPENGLYSKKDLTEYIAEYNAREMAEYLGDDFNIDNVPSGYYFKYEGFPNNWNIEDKKSLLETLKTCRGISRFSNLFLPGGGVLATIHFNSEIAKLFYEDIGYFNGEIWNGNIDKIKEKSLTFSKEGNY